MLLTAHTAEFDAGSAGRCARGGARPAPGPGVDAGELALATADGRRLELGRLRPVAGRGMMTGMASPAPPLLTSTANPRVRAARPCATGAIASAPV